MTHLPDVARIWLALLCFASAYQQIQHVERWPALRLSVLTALEMFTPPALCEGEGEQFDEATKTHRARLDFVFYPSST